MMSFMKYAITMLREDFVMVFIINISIEQTMNNYFWNVNKLYVRLVRQFFAKDSELSKVDEVFKILVADGWYRELYSVKCS